MTKPSGLLAFPSKLILIKEKEERREDFADLL